MLSRLFKKDTFNVHFNQGALLEVESGKGQFEVVMRDGDTVVHSANISEKHWTKSNRRFFCNWLIEVKNTNGKIVFSHRFDLKDRNVRINIDSKSLGDTLAWLPQIHSFAKQHPNCQVFVSQFWPDLFDQEKYPELTFISPDSVVENCYATYDLGYFFENATWHHPQDPREQPLGKVAADILGIRYVERRPFLKLPDPLPKKPNRNVCIAAASTAACKLWNRKDGWQNIVDYLRELNYEVIVIQKEETTLKNVTDMTGTKPISERIEQILQCEFFIGLGSGLSWLAWAVEKPVILISGFSEPWAEFEALCERVINQDVCHGCWNDPSYEFDRSDWNWCPRHQGTDRALECSTSITEAMVQESIHKVLNIMASDPDSPDRAILNK